MSPRRGAPEGGDALGRAIMALLLAGAIAMVLPPLLVGFGVATLMRRHQLRAGWALFGVVPAAVPLRLIGPARAAARLEPAATAALDGSGAALGALGVAALPFWLPLTAAAAAFKLWRDRRDRRDQLHGGLAERRQAHALGPLQYARVRRARRRDGSAPAFAGGGLHSAMTSRAAPFASPRSSRTRRSSADRTPARRTPRRCCWRGWPNPAPASWCSTARAAATSPAPPSRSQTAWPARRAVVAAPLRRSRA